MIHRRTYKNSAWTSDNPLDEDLSIDPNQPIVLGAQPFKDHSGSENNWAYVEYYAHSNNNHQMLNKYNIPHHIHGPPKVEPHYYHKITVTRGGSLPDSEMVGKAPLLNAVPGALNTYVGDTGYNDLD